MRPLPFGSEPGVERRNIEVADAKQVDMRWCDAAPAISAKRTWRDAKICSGFSLTKVFRHEKFDPFEPPPDGRRRNCRPG